MKIGTRVKHTRYGEGTVKSSNPLIIDFDSIGEYSSIRPETLRILGKASSYLEPRDIISVDGQQHIVDDVTLTGSQVNVKTESGILIQLPRYRHTVTVLGRLALVMICILLSGYPVPAHAGDSRIIYDAKHHITITPANIVRHPYTSFERTSAEERKEWILSRVSPQSGLYQSSRVYRRNRVSR